VHDEGGIRASSVIKERDSNRDVWLLLSEFAGTFGEMGAAGAYRIGYAEPNQAVMAS